MNVVWKYINGIDGIPDNRYMVSNDGDIIYIKTGTVLSKRISNKGYYLVSIQNSLFSIHRLVAIFFVPGRSEERNFVNHKNGCKLYNNWTNLEWATKSENTQHAYDTGLITILSGEDNPNATIVNSDVDKICIWLLEFNGDTNTVYDACEKNGIKASKQMIQQIKHKVSWVKISDKWFDSDRFKVNHFTKKDVHMICQSLVRNNGSVTKVLNELSTIIPGITYTRVNSIKRKQSHIKISDEYFKTSVWN